jgi:hypothetical protein
MKYQQITVFKTEIIKLDENKVVFDLYVSDRVNDPTYTNVRTTGGFNKGLLQLNDKQFTDFTQRLIAYVFTRINYFSDKQLKQLWNLNIHIYNGENPNKSKDIFLKYIKELKKLKLIK